VEGASITADFTGGMGWAPHAFTVSDSSGRYQLCDLTPTMGVDILVEKPGYQTKLVELTQSASTGSVDLEIVRH
jgi:hypothetical protein